MGRVMVALFVCFFYADQINNNNDEPISGISRTVESNQFANEHGAKVGGEKTGKSRNDTGGGNIVCHGMHVK